MHIYQTGDRCPCCPVDFQRPPDAGLQPVNPPQPMSTSDTLRKTWEVRLNERKTDL